MSNRTNTTITPSIARALLNKNLCNRPLIAQTVAAYAKRILAGSWSYHDEEQIVRDEDGNLIDGQHRCAAIVETGIALVGVPLVTLMEKPQVVIQCPHCQNTGMENEAHIYLTWNEVAYACVFTKEIQGVRVPVGSTDSDVQPGNKLLCGQCNGEWDVPKNAELQW